MKNLLSVVLALVALPTCAAAQPVVGSAEVTDGDTLSIGQTKIRLYGIDAPEKNQICQRDGSEWACGEEARRQLQDLVADRQVTCHGTGSDQYGRTLAVCEAGGSELNRTLVEYGWAVAFRRYSDAYVGAEFTAKSNRAGIWASAFTLPEEWRAENASKSEQASAPLRAARQHAVTRAVPAASAGCVIKGNRNRKGQWIYHLPGMPYYDATRAEEWFCTEAHARAAGYRRAIVP
jgi:endonuclease YncB( thermonuclease family)